ncbi:hypothetical protein IMG5_163600 [Ichthyophthirius multifiliis]|uniref:Uncharacterized protein n=1 Tax=Ichthyophthirius multifiliis TaxID=5932 RepID=G0R0D3_ICHMU|nr:hypothetical protein IMG5_163600 [Ichthyophthirius multifiliis]EGR29070.1 hypothetical protein IMG5_163600 [Ichthyophthirius multifiliis]|eukprot:XP_004030306.1 hypothetical protein IMG5_163600 [Ichthyophthirius multifiliis]
MLLHSLFAKSITKQSMFPYKQALSIKQRNSFISIKHFQLQVKYQFSTIENEKNFKPSTETPKSSDSFKPNIKDGIPNPVHDLVKPGKEKIIGSWLLFTAFAVFGMIVLGGYTRLSKSGLSMTKWKPIDYKLPQNDEEWQKEFENYKKYPEFLLANRNMALNEFKKIFFVEWIHRFYGSSLGFIFGIPLLTFTVLGWLKPKQLIRLSGLLCLGGLQGLIGWWMVKSGLDKKPEYQNRPRVSVYRLQVHLGMGTLLYSGLLWNALNLLRKPQEHILNAQSIHSTLKLRSLLIGLIHVIALNIISGATVAGLDAGKGYNTWPDMDGQFIPKEAFNKNSLIQNIFENKALVQFNHRMLAYLTTSWTIYTLYQSTNMILLKHQNLGLYLVGFLVFYQVYLGINTLLKGAPLKESSQHQANALLTLSAALYTLHCCRKPNALFLRNFK